MQRRGRKKRPFYQIVIADARSPRDGRYIERIGVYNPMTKPATIEVDRDKAYEWVIKGAQPTDTVRAILRFKGVYYKKHLMRGVNKGALTMEEAEKKYQDWIDAKDEKTAKRVEQAQREEAEKRAKFAGIDIEPPKPAAEPEGKTPEETPAAENEAPETEASAESNSEAEENQETETPAEVEANAESNSEAEENQETETPAEVEAEAEANTEEKSDK